jgi:hypothetical protein
MAARGSLGHDLAMPTVRRAAIALFLLLFAAHLPPSGGRRAS